MGIRFSDLFLDILGSIQSTIIGAIIITLPSGWTSAMSGRPIGIAGTPEEKVVVEELVVDEDVGKKCLYS